MKRSVVVGAVVLLLAIVAAVLAPPNKASAIHLQGTFVDDNQSPHQNGIEAVAAVNITSGCNPPTNDRFCPSRSMTRAEAATFIARALALPDDGNDYFIDDDGHVLEGGINRIAAAGITAGCNPPTNDRFCPDRSLNRAEFAAFMVRGLGLPPSSTDFFTDDDGHILENSINAIAEARITVGCNPPANTWFCPNRVLTRGETATLFTRALGLSHNPQRIHLGNWTPIECSKDGTVCELDVETYSGRSHIIEEGLFNRLPYAAGEESRFLASNSTFTLTVDGAAVALSQRTSQSSTQIDRLWSTTLVFSNGSHTLTGIWRRDGIEIQRTVVDLDAG